MKKSKNKYERPPKITIKSPKKLHCVVGGNKRRYVGREGDVRHQHLSICGNSCVTMALLPTVAGAHSAITRPGYMTWPSQPDRLREREGARETKRESEREAGH